MAFAKLKNIYENHYKKLLLIPLLLFVFAVIQISAQYATTGSFVQKGISLKGGSTITITDTTISSEPLEAALQQRFPQADISVRKLQSAGTTIGLIVEADAQAKEEIAAVIAFLKAQGVREGNYSIEVVGSSLGEGFFRQTLTALGIAFLLIALVVFAYFRVPIPCLAVIIAAVGDMVITLAIFNLLGMKLSSAGVAAFLMLVGYSVDSDMLLTARALKQHDRSLMERIYSSVMTGMTMTGTTVAAVVVALLLAQSEVVKQIMLILLIGLFVDMIMTWIGNVAILRWYLEKKSTKERASEHSP